jgi:hypothetical protein
MIPALLTRSTKRNYTLTQGTYAGLWQDRFCWIFNESGECIARIDTAHKATKPERVKVCVEVSEITIYEKLKQKRT